MNHPSRRELLAGAGAILGAGVAAEAAAAPDPAAHKRARTSREAPFLYGLNTSTIRGQGKTLSLVEKIDIVGKAGYQAIEPWIGEIDEHVKAGGTLKDLNSRIRDRGLTVESAIGFFEWIVDDDARRARALDEARRNMDLVAQIGGKRLAAPPVGATDRSDMDLRHVAERYRALLVLGDKCGVVPQVEVWGFSKTLGKLSEAAMVVIECGHTKACILPDVYHLYKGGSPFEGIRLLSGSAMHNFHLNDYPATPPRETIKDENRVFPGDGIAPLTQLFRDLNAIGYRGALSIELFNRQYWAMDPLEVAKTGLQKLRAAVRTALAA